MQASHLCDQRTRGDSRRRQQLRALALRRPQQQWRQHLQQQCSRQWWRRQSVRQRVPAAAAGPPGGEGKGPPEGMPVVSAQAFLTSATLGNGGMCAAGIVVGNALGLGVSQQWLHAAPSVPAALAYIAPLAALAYWGVTGADSIAGFQEMRGVFQQALIPQLRGIGFWGLGLLALGAGVGEETLFRACMQAGAASSLAGAAPELPAAAATALAWVGASLVFGAAHAITPTYFWFATGAGALFGVEYLTHGLATAAMSHWLYDWWALYFILEQWGGDSSSGSSAAAAARGDD